MNHTPSQNHISHDHHHIRDLLDRLHKQRDAYQKKANYLLVQIIGIFGIPAFLALWIGRYLDARFGTDRTLLVASLGVAFVLSWVFFIHKFKKLHREVVSVEQQIKDIKKTSVVSPQHVE